MLLLDDFIKDLKRTNQFGDESVTNDEPTADILRWLNRYRDAVANMTAWSWIVKQFNIPLVAGIQDITIDATIRKVVAINNGNGGRLQKTSLKQAMDWYTPSDALNDNNDLILGYFIDLGVDGNTGARKLRVFGKPSSNGTLVAYGISTFPIFAAADIATPANFLPFPDSIMNMISDLISSRISKFKGDANWAAYEKVAWNNLRIAMGEEESDPSDDNVTPLPPYFQKRRIMRRGGMVA